MIKLLHSADLHYSYRQYGWADREQDMYDAGWFVVNTAIAQKVDAVILSGDIYATAKPSATAVGIMMQQVNKLKEAGIRVLAIDGNHDPSKGEWSKVCGIEPLGSAYTHVGGTEVSIGGIDYMQPAATMEQLQRFVADKVKLDILMLHHDIAELAGFDEASSLSARKMSPLLKKLGVKYVAMGHIHKYAETVIDGIRWVYPGSPEVTASDQREEKSIELVCIEDGEVTTTVIPVVGNRPQLHMQFEGDNEKFFTELAEKKANVTKEPVLHIYATDEKSAELKLLETTLQTNKTLYRVHGLDTVEDDEGIIMESDTEFNRYDVHNALKEAVFAYFDEGTDEAELIQMLLRQKTPEAIKQIVTDYLERKDVEVQL